MDVVARLLGGDKAARQAVSRYRGGPEHVKPTNLMRRRTLWTPPGMGDLGKQHRQYLRHRRFDPDKLKEEWDLTATAHLSGPGWNWRVCFPICSQDGLQVAYAGRSISDKTKPKYKLPKDNQILTHPRSLLYGIHKAGGDSVVVVEGPTDVWRMGPGAVALLGVKWTVEQMNLLRAFPRRFIMLDPDQAGQRRAEEIAEWLGMFSGETELISDLPSDPGELDQGEANQIMKELIHA